MNRDRAIGMRNGVVELAMFLVAAGICAKLILMGSGTAPRPPMDQAFVNVDLHIFNNGKNWVFQYPVLSWAGGITGSLMVGLYKLVVPTSPETLNWHVKIFSSTAFLASLMLCCRALNARNVVQVGTLMLVVSSGLLLLEPSAEVLAGASLNFFAAALIGKRSPLLQGLLLAVFALVKIELLPISAGIALLVIWSMRGANRWTAFFCLSYLGALAVFMIPSIYFHGYKTVFLGRGIQAFEQHYCDVFFGIFDTADCLRTEMPGAKSVADAIFQYPAKYVHFLERSLSRSVANIYHGIGFLSLGLISLILPSTSSGHDDLRKLSQLALVAFALTFVVATAFAYMHPRYIDRFLGVLALAFAAQVNGLLSGRMRDSTTGIATFGILGGISVLNVPHLIEFLSAPHSY